MATIVPDMKNRRLFFLVVLLIAAFVPALPTGAQTLLRVATPGALTGALPIYLGAKKGVFSKHGLTVEVIATRNEQMNMQALMWDSVQFLGLTVIPVPLEYVWGINITRKVFMNKNREIVKNYLRGLAESVRLMMADKASTIAVMSQVLKIDDPDSLDYSYKMMRADARADLFPTEESIVNVLRTMSYEDPAFLAIPPYKFFDLSLIQELKAESR